MSIRQQLLPRETSITQELARGSEFSRSPLLSVRHAMHGKTDIRVSFLAMGTGRGNILLLQYVQTFLTDSRHFVSENGIPPL